MSAPVFLHIGHATGSRQTSAIDWHGWPLEALHSSMHSSWKSWQHLIMTRASGPVASSSISCWHIWQVRVPAMLTCFFWKLLCFCWKLLLLGAALLLLEAASSGCFSASSGRCFFWKLLCFLWNYTTNEKHKPKNKNTAIRACEQSCVT